MDQEPEAALAAAGAMLADGQTGKAMELLLAARARHPAHAGVARQWADGLQVSGRLAEAVLAYAQALQIDATSADSWYGMGCAYLAQQAYGDAAIALNRACELAPQSGAAHYNLAASLFQLGRVEAAVASFRRAARFDSLLAHSAHANIACIVPGSTDADNAAVLEARRLWADEEARRLNPDAPAHASGSRGLRTRAPPYSAAPPGRKWRIGYLSAFFGHPNWMKAVFSLINRHDRATFEIHLLSDGEPPSARSGYRDHEADVIHDIRGADNDRVAAYVGERGLDVLVDLNGYSLQSRLPLLMRRPAPHIVGWFNMFATTAIDAFDWIVGDDAVIPSREEVHYTEKIHRLPGTYNAFEVLYPVPDIVPPPCTAPGRALTFGCLGSHYKLTDAVIASWGRILTGAPRAALFVKNAALEDGSTQADLLGRLSAAGIDPTRVTLQGRSDHFEFIDAYRHVDIALDTFPYNGGTTTMEALWQGVPVLSFDGDRWASRTSKSLLLAAGLAEWLLADRESFELRAARVANDPSTPAMLAALRVDLRTRVANSAACDTGRACQAMEAFYAGIAGGT